MYIHNINYIQHTLQHTLHTHFKCTCIAFHNNWFSCSAQVQRLISPAIQAASHECVCVHVASPTQCPTFLTTTSTTILNTQSNDWCAVWPRAMVGVVCGLEQWLVCCVVYSNGWCGVWPRAMVGVVCGLEQWLVWCVA